MSITSIAHSTNCSSLSQGSQRQTLKPSPQQVPDAAVAEWIQATATEHTQEALVQWNNDLRSKRISEMPIELQVYLEGYIAEFIPSDKIVYTWFDVYDIEEQRI